MEDKNISDDRGGYLIYRCRRCGKTTTNVHVPSVFNNTIAIIYDDESAKTGSSMFNSMFNIHHCSDNHIGVMDFIGATYDIKKGDESENTE